MDHKNHKKDSIGEKNIRVVPISVKFCFENYTPD